MMMKPGKDKAYRNTLCHAKAHNFEHDKESARQDKHTGTAQKIRLG